MQCDVLSEKEIVKYFDVTIIPFILLMHVSIFSFACIIFAISLHEAHWMVFDLSVPCLLFSPKRSTSSTSSSLRAIVWRKCWVPTRSTIVYPSSMSKKRLFQRSKTSWPADQLSSLSEVRPRCQPVEPVDRWLNSWTIWRLSIRALTCLTIKSLKSGSSTTPTGLPSHSSTFTESSSEVLK